MIWSKSERDGQEREREKESGREVGAREGQERKNNTAANTKAKQSALAQETTRTHVSPCLVSLLRRRNLSAASSSTAQTRPTALPRALPLPRSSRAAAAGGLAVWPPCLAPRLPGKGRRGWRARGAAGGGEWPAIRISRDLAAGFTNTASVGPRHPTPGKKIARHFLSRSRSLPRANQTIPNPTQTRSRSLASPASKRQAPPNDAPAIAHARTHSLSPPIGLCVRAITKRHHCASVSVAIQTCLLPLHLCCPIAAAICASVLTRQRQPKQAIAANDLLRRSLEIGVLIGNASSRLAAQVRNH